MHGAFHSSIPLIGRQVNQTCGIVAKSGTVGKPESTRETSFSALPNRESIGIIGQLADQQSLNLRPLLPGGFQILQVGEILLRVRLLNR